MILTSKELKEISGGGLSFGIGALIVGGIIFMIGFLDGYSRPFRCRK